MKQDLTRMLIRKAIDKQLRDLQKDPKRTINNLLELGKNIGGGPLQQQFAAIVQGMQSNENGAYRVMLENLATGVESENVKTFGVNLGYNSGVLGAKKIRQFSQSGGFGIPWALILEVGKSGAIRSDTLSDIVRQGIELGIETYILIASGVGAAWLLPTVRRYDDCAFIVLTTAEDILRPESGALASAHNMMVLLPTASPAAAAAAEKLRQRRMLFGCFARYNDVTADYAVSDANMSAAAALGGTAVFVLPGGQVSAEAERKVKTGIRYLRDGQKYPFLPIDVLSDFAEVDRGMSGRECSAVFGADGCLRERFGAPRQTCNLSEKSLKEVLQAAFSK